MTEEYLLTGRLEPTNEPYAIAKIAGIKLCESFNRQHGTCYCSVMPTNLYGANDNFDLENSHVLPALIRKFHLAKLAAHGDLQGIIKDESRYGPIPDDFMACLVSISKFHGYDSLLSGSVSPSIVDPTPALAYKLTNTARALVWGRLSEGIFSLLFPCGLIIPSWL